MGFIHVDKYDSNVHMHFVMNSVNCFTGNKLVNEKSFYQNLLNYLRTDYQILNWEFVTYN